ncbi:hypothetical protein BDV25DRAFT_162075 [Aspergillus avenaceus]|uniref:Uncharacterized protein n=1 Tax=Aspergillus avenaceus TaxID=36643 RepID=A0A5N6TK04_ASPAV|nr:hypothetical protein BDV25DRAFT_162075 [Aspergillus avenaceus]
MMFRRRPTGLSTSQPRIPRQEIAHRYLHRNNLQALLEKLFPDHPGLNFHIKSEEDKWLFDAPRPVTESELKEVSD